MKLLHTSDLHIGISLFGEDMLPFQERLGVILSECVISCDADCIVIAGDVYDSAVVTGEAVKCWDRLCSRLAGIKKENSLLTVPVIVISGNHDSAPRLSVCSELLEQCGLHIRGSFRDFERPIAVGDTDIYCIPYFNLSEARELFSDSRISSYTDAFEEMTSRIRASWDPQRKHIIAAHCFVTGAGISESERASKGAVISAGGAQMVSADVFREFDYAALGHLHRPQTIKCSADDKCIVRYSGTPMPYSFSEVGQAKSVTVYDTVSRCAEEIMLPELISLETVRGSYEEVMAAEVPEKSYIRVILTDRTTAAGLYENLRERFPNMLRLECAAMRTADGEEKENGEEITAMSAAELAERYMHEMFGQELTAEHLKWLDEAENFQE